MNPMHSNRHPGALATHTAMRLSNSDLISLDLQPGDSVRSDCGTLWITVDGEPRDLLLEPGEVHTTDAPARINVSALRSACLVVLGRAPLQWQRVGEAGRGVLSRAAQAVAAGLLRGGVRVLAGVGR